MPILLHHVLVILPRHHRDKLKSKQSTAVEKRFLPRQQFMSIKNLSPDLLFPHQLQFAKVPM